MALQAWVLYDLGFSLRTSITDSFVSNFLLAGACVLTSNNLKYYLPQQRRYGYMLVLSLLTAGAWLLSIRYLLPLSMPTEPDYERFLSQSLPIRFGVSSLVIGCMSMISMIWFSFQDQKTSAQRKTEAEQLTKDAELYKLRQQLQPHFLFNSLNSINALIGSRPQEARAMVHQLSDFLRGTLKREDQQWIALDDELEYLRLYLDIEKVRFGNRLSPEFNIDPATRKMQIPPMLLQPLVENAIKFGLYDTTGETVISLTTLNKNNTLEITVQNPFDEETTQPKRGTGFGLHSIQRRLYLLFARHDLLFTRTQGHIFITTILVPQTLLNKTETSEKA